MAIYLVPVRLDPSRTSGARMLCHSRIKKFWSIQVSCGSSQHVCGFCDMCVLAVLPLSVARDLWVCVLVWEFVGLYGVLSRSVYHVVRVVFVENTICECIGFLGRCCRAHPADYSLRTTSHTHTTEDGMAEYSAAARTRGVVRRVHFIYWISTSVSDECAILLLCRTKMRRDGCFSGDVSELRERTLTGLNICLFEVILFSSCVVLICGCVGFGCFMVDVLYENIWKHVWPAVSRFLVNSNCRSFCVFGENRPSWMVSW